MGGDNQLVRAPDGGASEHNHRAHQQLTIPNPLAYPLAPTGADASQVVLLSFPGASDMWVTRVVEDLSFDEPTRVFRTYTINANLHPMLRRQVLGTEEPYKGRWLLPIAYLRRARRRHIEVSDAVGAPLPRLSHREERRLVANALMHHIEIAATACELGVASIMPRQNDGSADHGRRKFLSALLKPFVQLLGRTPASPVQPEPYDVSLDILCQWAREVIELPVAESTELSSRLTLAFEQLAAEFPDSSDEWYAANTLATNFRTHHLIVVEVPEAAATRHIFRVMYSEAIVHDRGGRIRDSAVGDAYHTIWRNESWWHRARRWRVVRLLAWPFATPSRERVVELPTCTYGERHHVQILCPNGMRLVGGEAGWIERLDDGSTRLGRVVQDDDRQPSKVHLFLPRDGSDNWGPAMARVHLYPNPVGVITSTIVTAFLCLAIGVVSGGLVFGWSLSAWWHAGPWLTGC